MNKRQAAKIVKHPRGHRRDQWLRASRKMRILDWPAKLYPARPTVPGGNIWTAACKCGMCRIESYSVLRFDEDSDDSEIMYALPSLERNAASKLRKLRCPHVVAYASRNYRDVS